MPPFLYNTNMIKSDLYNHQKSIQQYDFQRSSDSRIENLSLQWIDFSELMVTQNQIDTFDPDHVRDILSEYHPALVRASSVAFVKNHYILWEGQHTATANWLSGMDKVPCIVYETDNLEFKQIPSVEKFDTSQLAMLIDMLAADTGATTIDEIRNFINPQDNYS